jgi:hypothetical protein
MYEKQIFIIIYLETHQILLSMHNRKKYKTHWLVHSNMSKLNNKIIYLNIHSQKIQFIIYCKILFKQKIIFRL